MAAGGSSGPGLVLRIHSPGGGVTASDIVAEELRRFRQATGEPVVACLMDVATGGLLLGHRLRPRDRASHVDRGEPSEH